MPTLTWPNFTTTNGPKMIYLNSRGGSRLRSSAHRHVRALGKSARHADRPVRAQPRRPGRRLSGAVRGDLAGPFPLCQADDMRKYVIMGIQGSGKGTQAKMLEADLDLVHI